ncbi:MAG: VOC family protein [Verrucomicrobia bacterium]|nr:VOC family protein [Verrucomicrobiota bacterium]
MAEAAGAPPFPPLTTVSGNPRLPGKFVWADLVTDDLARAQAFYGGLFRWSFRDYGGYLIAANDERPLCGMFQRPRPEGKPEAKPRWIGFVSVPNVKRAADYVSNAGGKVLAAPAKFPKRGEQAIFADSEGALFGVIKSSSGDPEDFLAEPGDWIWMQLLSRDGRQAAEFYRGIGNYEIIENSTADRLSDFVLASDGYARATVRTIPVDRDKVVPVWLPFVRVRSMSESLAKASQLGGQVLLPPSAELREGKVAVIADPTGAALGLLEWDGKSFEGGQKP